MRRPDFYLTRGDEKTPLVINLTDGDGVAINLSTGSVTAYFRKEKDTAQTVTKAMTITAAATGEVTISAWTGAEFDAGGDGIWLFNVRWTDGSSNELTVPNDGTYWRMLVSSRLV